MAKLIHDTAAEIVIGARMTPAQAERFCAAAKRVNVKPAVVARRLLVWWANPRFGKIVSGELPEE